MRLKFKFSLYPTLYPGNCTKCKHVRLSQFGHLTECTIHRYQNSDCLDFTPAFEYKKVG